MTKTSDGAQILDIGQHQRGSIKGFRLSIIGDRGGQIIAIEFDLLVSSVAEGLVAGLPTATEGIPIPIRILLALTPGD
jgi:hypothetical protein